MRIAILILCVLVSAASAQTVTLSTGPSCSYSSISIAPNGNASVACSGTPPPGQCTYTYSDWTVCSAQGIQTRTVTDATPPGCTGTPHTSQACTPPVPPPVGNCTPFTLKLSGADILRLQPGQIACAVLPDVTASGGTTSSGQILFGESTVAPRNATIEITISRTAGLIDPNAGYFYQLATNTAFVNMTWLEKPPPAWGVNWQQIANAYKLPFADKTKAPWYVNVRFNYAAGDCPYAPCGFVNQWNYGGY